MLPASHPAVLAELERKQDSNHQEQQGRGKEKDKDNADVEKDSVMIAKWKSTHMELAEKRISADEAETWRNNTRDTAHAHCTSSIPQHLKFHPFDSVPVCFTIFTCLNLNSASSKYIIYACKYVSIQYQ